MKNTSNGYSGNGTRQEWLPSQNWQEIAKKRQEKIAIAEAESAYKEQILKRRIVLTLFVLGTIGVVAPAAIYPRLSYADALDASMGYTMAQESLTTFGGRLDNADPIVSDGSEFLDDPTQPVATEEDQAVQADPVMFGEYGSTAPVINQQQPAVQDVEPTAPAPEAQFQQEPLEQQTAPPVVEQSYADEPASAPAEQVSSIQPESVASPESSSASVSSAETVAPNLDWWSVPSWSTASAPQYDAIGIWDTHYYIAHNWTSYGEAILGLQNGDVLSIDGQRLMVIDSDYFYAGTDYETVRTRFGWDVWCVQTCYGSSQVRIVSLIPIS